MLGCGGCWGNPPGPAGYPDACTGGGGDLHHVRYMQHRIRTRALSKRWLGHRALEFKYTHNRSVCTYWKIRYSTAYNTLPTNLIEATYHLVVSSGLAVVCDLQPECQRAN